MLPTLWQIAWRAVLLVLIISLVWQIPTRLPLFQAEKSLKNGVDVFAVLSEDPNFLELLTRTEWEALKIRDRGDIANYYDAGVRGRDESKKRLDLASVNLDEIALPSNDPKFYTQVNLDLRSANEQLKVSRKLYQDLTEVFSYYEQSTLALFNLLYYDPGVAIKFYRQSPDYELLLQRFGLDYAGLQKVEERLKNLPTYQDDNLTDFALALVRPLTSKVKQISDLAGQQKDKEAIILAEEFDREVRSVQEKIVKNRQEFWKRVNKQSLINQLSNLRTKDLEIRSSLENRLLELSHRK